MAHEQQPKETPISADLAVDQEDSCSSVASSGASNRSFDCSFWRLPSAAHPEGHSLVGIDSLFSTATSVASGACALGGLAPYTQPYLETLPATKSQDEMLQFRLQQAVAQFGQRPYIPSHLALGQQQPFTPGSQQQGPPPNLVHPIRQPLQPGSVPAFSRDGDGAPPKLEELPCTGTFYWPMNNIQQPWAAPNSVSVTDHLAGGCHNACSTITYSHTLAQYVNKLKYGFSPSYNGDPRLERNRSANIPDELNCSLFLVNLPSSLTTRRLIAAIHALGPTGRIYATHINAPEPDRKHFGCAAKVIFFELAAAHAFYEACLMKGFTVDGYTARVMWNRIKTAEQTHAKSTTRVLLIGGNPHFVNAASLTEYFHTKLQFQVDCVITHNDGLTGDTDAVVEYRFGSFRCQAEAAKMALVREHPNVRCFFHFDPCDPLRWKPSENTTVAAPPTRPFHTPGPWPGPQRPAVFEGAEGQQVDVPYKPAAPTWGSHFLV